MEIAVAETKGDPNPKNGGEKGRKGIEYKRGFKIVNGLGVGDIQTVNFVPPQRSGVHQQSEMQKNQKEREQRRGREFAACECRFFR